MAGRKSSNETTSPRVAKIASQVLRDGRYSKAAKSTAGSALTQAPNKGGKKK
jgi:hypothetical protein